MPLAGYTRLASLYRMVRLVRMEWLEDCRAVVETAVGLGVGRAVVADLDLSRYHAAGQTVWSSFLAPRAVC